MASGTPNRSRLAGVIAAAAIIGFHAAPAVAGRRPDGAPAPLKRSVAARALERRLAGTPRARTAIGRAVNVGLVVIATGPINGLRTRWRKRRFTTLPGPGIAPALAEGDHVIEFAALQPQLLRPLPAVRHAMFGLRGPGEVEGTWFHLAFDPDAGLGHSGVKMITDLSRPRRFYPSADNDIVRLKVSREQFVRARAEADGLVAQGPGWWVPGQHSCVTQACRIARAGMDDSRSAPSRLARFNGGLMLHWLRSQGAVDVQPLLQPRARTKGRLVGPVLDHLLGLPGKPARLGRLRPWGKDRIILPRVGGLPSLQRRAPRSRRRPE